MLPAKSHPSSHANGCCPADRNRSTPEPYHGLIRPIFEIVKSLQGWNHHNLVRHNCGYRSSVNECLDRAALSLHLNVVHRSEIDIWRSWAGWIQHLCMVAVFFCRADSVSAFQAVSWIPPLSGPILHPASGVITDHDFRLLFSILFSFWLFPKASVFTLLFPLS